VVVPGINGSTLLDDTYNASPASTVAALNLLNDLTPGPGGRRVAVLGDMLELGHYTDEGHKIVARRAADVVHTLVTVGELGRAIGVEARDAGFAADRLFITADFEEAIALLRRELQRGDLVLVKGSRAVGMESIAQAITDDTVNNDTVNNGGVAQPAVRLH
jgi:UDP-N-acetylmuramoyl-tripeptide--D-alanyl-D-alanine ligase